MRAMANVNVYNTSTGPVVVDAAGTQLAGGERGSFPDCRELQIAIASGRLLNLDTVEDEPATPEAELAPPVPPTPGPRPTTSKES